MKRSPIKRKPTSRKKRRSELQKKKAAAWTLFSRYIRLRDCLATTGTLTRGKCCTCDKIIEMGRDAHAGHFIGGRLNAILFDERGVHLQCATDNMFRQGAGVDYYRFMLDKYGGSVIDELVALSKTTRRFTIDELDEMMASWRQSIEQYEEQAIKQEGE
jgi:hypothetical protein